MVQLPLAIGHSAQTAANMTTIELVSLQNPEAHNVYNLGRWKNLAQVHLSCDGVFGLDFAIVYTYIYIHIYIFVYVCLYVCMHIYIYIYTI